jgi:hypothetical protein
VKTYPLAIGFEMSTMAVCICDAAIGARMESGMPFGLWSSPIAPCGGLRSAWSSIQLTEAEEAFRLHKSDLVMRPVWHQKQQRVQAHILACFLADVLWKTLGRWCNRAGLGDEPRKIFTELEQISLVDVVLPTRTGISICKRCVSRPTDHQAILLQRLGLEFPHTPRICRRLVKTSQCLH